MWTCSNVETLLRIKLETSWQKATNSLERHGRVATVVFVVNFATGLSNQT